MIETIVSAAVKQRGVIVSLPAPARHDDIIPVLHSLTAIFVAPVNQGFLTSTGRFVSREEAAKVAVSSGQIVTPRWGHELYSEDLW